MTEDEDTDLYYSSFVFKFHLTGTNESARKSGHTTPYKDNDQQTLV